MNCGNCDTSINLPVSPNDFVLNEHLCDKCQLNVTTVRLILTRATAHSPWGLESAQPLRVNFQVPGQVDEHTSRTPIPESFK